MGFGVEVSRVGIWGFRGSAFEFTDSGSGFRVCTWASWAVRVGQWSTSSSSSSSCRTPNGERARSEKLTLAEEGRDVRALAASLGFRGVRFRV